MGGGGSKDGGPASAPPADVRNALTTSFHSIRKRSSLAPVEGLQSFLEDKGFSFKPELVSRLHCTLSKGSGTSRSGHPLDEHAFVSKVGCLVGCGPVEERSKIFFSLHTANAEGKATLNEVKWVLQEFLKELFSSPVLAEVFPQSSAWPNSEGSCTALTEQLVRTLDPSAVGDPSQHVVCPSLLCAWLSQTPLAGHLLSTVFACMFLHGSMPLADLSVFLGLTEPDTGRKSYETLLVPEAIETSLIPYGSSFKSSLIHLPTAVLLNTSLPSDVKGRMYPLFSSSHHGESFSTLVGRIVGKGPTLLVVQDTGGHVFGGFAAQSWSIGPNFYGSPSCFLFTLLPTFGVYEATGYNSNYVYLEQNAQTLPNGLVRLQHDCHVFEAAVLGVDAAQHIKGMGGQLNYFGLWLSGNFGRGHSMARPQCTTYGSPTLSSEEEFQVDTLEVWGVGEPPQPKDGKEKSILDKDKEAQALLEMASKPMHSAWLREPSEDNTEDNSGLTGEERA